MQKQGRNKGETIVQTWDRNLLPPQGIHKAIPLSCSAEINGIIWVVFESVILKFISTLLNSIPYGCAQSFSCIWLFATPWTGLSRQEYWSGLPFPSPADLPDLGIEPGFPALQADSFLSEPPGKPSNQHVGCLLLIEKVSQESLWLDLLSLPP